MKNALLLLALAAIILFAGLQFADAETRVVDMGAWQDCARMAATEFAMQDPVTLNIILCQKVLNTEPGPDCREKALALNEIGLLEQLANKYVYDYVVVPACGQMPATE